MLSTLAWVPRGVAKQRPDMYDDAAAAMAGMSMDDDGPASADDAVAAAAAAAARMNDSSDEDSDGGAKMDGAAAGDAAGIVQKYNLQGYDEEDEGIGGINMFGSVVGAKSGMTYHASNAEDPYLTQADATEDLADEEEEAYEVKPSDMMLLATRCEEEYFNMEVYIYEEEEEEEEQEEQEEGVLAQPGNLFIHHDLMLPDFALASAWTGFNPSAAEATRGNYVAVATAAPVIEVWNLDVFNAMEPSFVLGGAHMLTPEEMAAELRQRAEAEGKGGGKKKKKKKKGKKKQQQEEEEGPASVKFEEGSHRDSVLGLAWNPAKHHVLASCSADRTVKLWDTAQQACITTYTHHSDKVNSLAWHPSEPALLLSGGFDRAACIVDVRVAAVAGEGDGGGAAAAVPRWALDADTEVVCWNPHQPHHFYVSTDTGTVTCFDARQAGSAPLWRWAAHAAGKDCSVLCFNPLVPHMLMTASTDKTLKLWDVASASAAQPPACVYTHDSLDAGAIFAAAFAPDEPFYIGVAGAKGTVRLWDSLSALPVRRRFEGRAPQLAARKARQLPLAPAEDS